MTTIATTPQRLPHRGWCVFANIFVLLCPRSGTVVCPMGWTRIDKSLSENKLLRQNGKEDFSFSTQTSK